MVAAKVGQEQRSKKRKYEEATQDKKKRVNQRRGKEMRVIWTMRNIRLKTVG
jgi:hypothetical protein